MTKDFDSKLLLFIQIWYDKIIKEKNIKDKLVNLKELIDNLTEMYYSYKISHPEFHKMKELWDNKEDEEWNKAGD